MIRISLLISFIFGSFLLHADPSDSLIKFSDLVFRSEAEKRDFLNANIGTTHYLEIFLSSYGTKKVHSKISALTKIDNCVAELKKNIVGKTETKQLKYIYKHVHETFFTRYDNNNSFSDIFEDGRYNCVSSTALYAIIFTKLNIPFQIMEKPEHVFLIAYPETHNVYIETTSPDRGYLHFSDIYINSYVEYLYNSRIISKQQYESGTASKIFEQYYYSSTPISLRALASIQFSNFGYYQIEEKDLQDAIEDLKKACYLSTFSRQRYLLKYLLMHQTALNNYSDPALVKNFSILCRFNALEEKDLPDQSIQDEFSRLTHHLLVDKYDLKKYKESFDLISASITDTVLKDRISFIYHYELSRLSLLEKKNEEETYDHLKIAYKVNPDHADLRSMIITHLGRKLDNTLEVENVLKICAEYSKDFPFLKTHDWFNEVKVNCILQLAYQSFWYKDLAKGERYLKEFEEICKADNTVQASAAYVEKAYAEGATAYYKKGNVKRCKELLRTGLIYAPNSFGLQMRLSQS